MNFQTSKPEIGIVGYGRVGRVLARALIAGGYTVSGIVDNAEENVKKTVQIDYEPIPMMRDLAELSPHVEMLMLCVPDNAIPKIVDRLVDELKWTVKSGRNHQSADAESRFTKSHSQIRIVAHTAGALPAQVLERVREFRAQPLAWHPFQTFTGNETPKIFEGVSIAMDGDPAAMEVGGNIATSLGAIPIHIPAELRPLYHISGVFACNFMAALVSVSVDLLEKAGLERKTACRALVPLLSSTMQNITKLGIPDAITGPLSRGDDETVQVHQRVLKDNPEELELYRQLSRIILRQIGKDEVGGIKVKP